MVKNKSKFKVLEGLTLITQLGLSIVISILFGFFIGQLIDKKLGTNYIFAIVFIIIGAVGGILNIFKLGIMPKPKDKE